MPCGVQMGDEAEITTPKAPRSVAPTPRPCQGGALQLWVWLVGFQTLRVLWGEGEGQRLVPELNGWSFRSVLYFSFPGLAGLSPGTAGLCHRWGW